MLLVGDGRLYMGFDTGIPMSLATVTEGLSSNEDALWQMNLRSREAAESGHYPVREGEPDCSYYIRTGLCRFGVTCRFNHPTNRKQAIVSARMKGEYPERIGQLECQYYLKTGTCKFGATCKFHHPRDKAGIAGRVSLNVLGYPLRPHDIECAYYLRTGECKFGGTCKFHHPQPSNMMVSFRGSPIYPTGHTLTTLGQQSYPAGLTNWSLPRSSYISSSRWQGPSNYAPLILPHGVLSVQGWNAYNGQLGLITSEQQQNSYQSEATNEGSTGTYSSYRSGTRPMGYYALHRENVFPERPDQPECQFYMKTGDCKFGAVCRYHHPRERLIPAPDCVLSPLGLPLRPGEPLCIFYSRYGICKFGPSCKFDHPMGVFTYDLSAHYSTDAPNVRRLLGSSSGTAALNLSTEGLMVASSVYPSRLSPPDRRQMPSNDNNIDTDG